MKADIPDSIIISRDEDGVLHHSYWTTDQQLVPFEATKFIRKEALLEWAKECFHLQDEGSWYSKGVADAFSRVINKLNEM